MSAIGWSLTAVISASLLAALTWQAGARSQRPRKLANPDVPDIETAWEPYSFMSGGSKLEAWLIWPAAGSSAERENSPVVVVAHGWGSNRTRVLRYARPLYKAGFAVLIYDARSHGDSESIKAPSALMFRDDAMAAVGAARRIPGVDPERIAVLGHSLGGFGAVLALDLGMKVRAVITDSMPVRFETMVRAELKRRRIPALPLAYLIPPVWLLRAGITYAQFKAADIRSVLSRHAGEPRQGRTPVLMIHSERDDFIRAEDLRRLKEQLPEGTIDTLFVRTEGHSSSEREPAFWDKVMPFLNKSLRGRGD
ncbi:alpha/beta hydrolase [Paenibacillus arenilitoris]|uniref:Alpha/beta fold hydrolase n=1 Tax=Paenibacillus arenilitoris TaxID=2772299 RepID=A0A927CIX5_9BACL|nr:alpha/beta fold hydrolase [Paenibacillus arenilitoris]MBD2867927.1 alpha/beta fold hydrolase [Paenibacillus arenilitoris]